MLFRGKMQAEKKKIAGKQLPGAARLHAPELGAPDGAARQRAVASAQHHAAPAIVRDQRVLHARAGAYLRAHTCSRFRGPGSRGSASAALLARSTLH